MTVLCAQRVFSQVALSHLYLALNKSGVLRILTLYGRDGNPIFCPEQKTTQTTKMPHVFLVFLSCIQPPVVMANHPEPWLCPEGERTASLWQEAGMRAAVMTAALAKQARLSFSGQDIQGQPGAGPGGTSSSVSVAWLKQEVTRAGWRVPPATSSAPASASAAHLPCFGGCRRRTDILGSVQRATQSTMTNVCPTYFKGLCWKIAPCLCHIYLMRSALLGCCFAVGLPPWL